MPFVPKTLEEILLDMINYVRTNSQLTDFNVGSVIRTVLEAAALEDREQYMRMVQILKAFSYRTAAGVDLDRRAADFNIVRLPGSKAQGHVIFMDNQLKRTYISSPILVGATTSIVEDPSVFGVLPVDVRIGEGTPEQEENQITAIDLSINTVTFGSALSYDHPGLSSLGTSINEWEIGSARISEISGDPDRVINSGITVSAPAIGDLPAVEFVTNESGYILNGNFQSGVITITATSNGPEGTVGPKRIRSFPSGVPYSGAMVVNPEATGGGSYSETDTQFAERIENTIGSLGGSTVNAILARARAVTLPVSNQRVQKVSVKEEFVINTEDPNGRVTVYIDDGSGNFNPERIEFPFGVVNAFTPQPSSTVPLSVQEGTLPDRGYILLGDDASEYEIVEYNGLTYSGLINNIQLVAATTKDHAAGDGFVYVTRVDDETTLTNRFYNLANIAIVEENFSLFCLKPSGDIVVLDKYDVSVNNWDTADYILAPGIGQVEIIRMNNIPEGSQLYAWHIRYGGLIYETQKTLDGDIRNPVAYPGVRAAGVNLVVLAPVYVGIDIMLSLILAEGVDGGTERERADRIIRNYVNGLNCGESFILTEVIRRVKTTSIVDMVIEQPESNVRVSENEVIFIKNLSVN